MGGVIKPVKKRKDGEVDKGQRGQDLPKGSTQRRVTTGRLESLLELTGGGRDKELETCGVKEVPNAVDIN